MQFTDVVCNIAQYKQFWTSCFSPALAIGRRDRLGGLGHDYEHARTPSDHDCKGVLCVNSQTRPTTPARYSSACRGFTRRRSTVMWITLMV